MKIHTDFVTNSSSASYMILVAEIRDLEGLKALAKEEFGNRGVKAVERFTADGKDVLNEVNSYICGSYYMSVGKEDIIPQMVGREKSKYLFVNRDVEGDTDAHILADLLHADYVNEIAYDTWTGHDG